MKVTVVPAQVTTVEDRIFGNLSFSQLILLVIPIFLSVVMYIGLPPFTKGSLYKYICILILFLICSSLAIRFKGKIVAFWLATILRYNIRPKYYIDDKSFRKEETMFSSEETKVKEKVKTKNQSKVIDVGSLVVNFDPSKLQFKTSKKGGLYVNLAEIKEQNI